MICVLREIIKKNVIIVMTENIHTDWMEK